MTWNTLLTFLGGTLYHSKEIFKNTRKSFAFCFKICFIKSQVCKRIFYNNLRKCEKLFLHLSRIFRSGAIHHPKNSEWCSLFTISLLLPPISLSFLIQFSLNCKICAFLLLRFQWKKFFRTQFRILLYFDFEFIKTKLNSMNLGSHFSDK